MAESQTATWDTMCAVRVVGQQTLPSILQMPGLCCCLEQSPESHKEVHRPPVVLSLHKVPADTCRVGGLVGEVTLDRALGRRQPGSKRNGTITARAPGKLARSVTPLHRPEGSLLRPCEPGRGQSGGSSQNPGTLQKGAPPTPLSEAPGLLCLSSQTPYPEGRAEAQPHRGPHAPGRKPGHRQ